ncbi:class I SAM-dependent methyltransferase [Pseudoalteromonas mariniglutinosa]|uniref:class I SAM-dependent methyltransferase n=1 Tax=Pseudoalteromonas mariniglutinosa TaxID=206042 RepID=UPI00384B79E2
MFEISLLIMVSAIAISIVWSTLILGISPMPSSNKARHAMLKLTEETGDGRIFELGSGWGNIVLALAKKYPDREIVGYELSLVPWLTSILVTKIYGVNNVKIYRKNFLAADLSEASVILCYLFPAGMNTIEKKLTSQPETANYLISNNFALMSQVPHKTIVLNDLYHSPIYLYKL